MSDRTTTRRAREWYVSTAVRNGKPPMGAKASWDAWLAEVERAAAEKALTEAARDYRSGQLTGIFMGRDEYPRAWLEARAAALGLTAGQEGENDERI